MCHMTVGMLQQHACRINCTGTRQFHDSRAHSSHLKSRMLGRNITGCSKYIRAANNHSASQLLRSKIADTRGSGC